MSARPRLLDLFSGAGGVAMGYARAGFDVVGVDIAPQPHYPFEFHQMDALGSEAVPLFFQKWDAVHASPPCQAYSAMSACRPGLSKDYPDLVGPVRDRLKAWGGPWVIENVVGAPLINPTLLCGSMFDLALHRHRMFESNIPLPLMLHGGHDKPTSRAGHWKPGTIISVSGNCSPIAVAREAMGIDWMNRAELAEAIPPAYTLWLGQQLLTHLRAVA